MKHTTQHNSDKTVTTKDNITNEHLNELKVHITSPKIKHWILNEYNNLTLTFPIQI